MGLVARELESHGIATVVVGSALDIMQACGAPRFVFSDIPLGNSCGFPYDRLMQRRTLEQALSLLEQADAAGVVRQTDWHWGDNESWRPIYARVDARNAEALKRAGDERRARQRAQRDKS
ncbi:MAG: hypothetical protein AB8B93_11520 [Pseudomonadales bacterium]